MTNIKKYLLTTSIILIAGIVWVFLRFYPEYLRFIAMAIAILGCAIVNLIYLIPTKSNLLKFVVPGIITVIAYCFLIHGSGVEERFFSFFGIVNLLMGIFWWLYMIIKGSIPNR
jgi:hypothetical protein